ncbi:hypothetical protein POX_a01613 [Penicillium oxalicum]|nr:hypothetical protein POX_a01613 [Penicillium oxalicum]KAI2795010.1 hypothetical protein POX_a01613 [Penicillium oxalicum]
MHEGDGAHAIYGHQRSLEIDIPFHLPTPETAQ